MDTLTYIVDKYGLNIERRMPVEIPGMGRDNLAALFCELGFRTGAEIGVEAGLYSEVLCKANPELKLYAVDAWKAYSGYREHVTQSKLDAIFAQAQGRLVLHNCEIIRGFSMDTARLFEPNSLDFVYIDSNHSLPFVIADIHEWSKRVRPGGIIAGHDYKKTKAPIGMLHVVYAVQAYTGAYKISPWFVLGRREVRQGETRDKSRSWMWVKQ